MEFELGMTCFGGPVCKGLRRRSRGREVTETQGDRELDFVEYHEPVRSRRSR